MYETNHELELASRFIQYTGKNVFLTGKAGTGKTTFLRNLRQHLPKRMVVVAPTGVAAINAGGVTIHSLFQLSFGPYIPDYQFQQQSNSQVKRFNREKINILRSIDLLVIDEVSMVRADLLDGIDDTLRRFRDRSKPFGGVQLLMIGDLQQLSPVAKEEEWNILKAHYQTPYFFSSHALQKSDYVTIELTKVYRQSDERFLDILNKIRNNQADYDCLTELNKRYIPNFTPSEDEGYITLTTHNYQAQQINASHLERLKARPYTFKATIEGEFPEHSYPTDAELVLKEGAQVMFIKNDPSYEKQFYNGKIGKVVSVDDESIFVQCADSTVPIEVQPQQWENAKYEIDEATKEIKEKVIGMFTQYPLKTAWAITIHKSQGLTFDKAIINANASFAHGQVYVALSRCRTLEGLVLDAPMSASSIISDGQVRQFTNTIATPTEDAFTQSKLNYGYQLLSELFSFAAVNRLLYQCLRTVQENVGAMPAAVKDGLLTLSSAVKAELIQVSEKFDIQLRQLIGTHNSIEECEPLQERVQKAADYFFDKLKNISTAFEALPADTDNKQVRKLWDDSEEKLQAEFRVKHACLSACLDGFSIKRYLDARAKALLEEPKKREPKKTDKPIATGAIPHPELYAELRSWRHEKAAELGTAHHLILKQETMLKLLEALPSNYGELQAVKGFGKKKVQQLGAELLDIIRSYRWRMDMPLADMDAAIGFEETKKSKPDTKRLSFDMFKQGLSVAEIADERQLTEGTIEGHLSHFVETGELEIETLISADKLEQISRFFVENEVKSLTEAKQALGEEVSWNELRMVAKWIVRNNSEN